MNRSMIKRVLIVVSLVSFGASAVFAQELNRREEDAFYVAAKAYQDGFYDVSLTLLGRFLKDYMDSDKKIEALIYVGQCYFGQEKYLKALNQFETVLKMEGVEPYKDRVYFWLGEIYAKGRDYKQAAEFYNQLIRQYKDSPYLLSAYQALAHVQGLEGKFEEAVGTYRSILALFKDTMVSQKASFGICEIMYQMRDYKELKKELSLFISRYPDSPFLSRTYFYQGEADFYLEQYEDAIAAYAKVQNLSESEEQTALANVGMGWSYLKLKRFDEARVVFSRFSDENEPLGVVLGRAVLEAGVGEQEKALALFDNVIAADREEAYAPLAYFGKAEALYNLSRFDDAIISYRIALDKLKMASRGLGEPRELRDKIRYGLAWSYLKIGDFRSAQEEFQKVASFSSDKIFKLSAACQLGDTYQDAGQYKEAIEAYQDFLKNYPDSAYSDYVQYQLGLTWLKEENMDSAILAFRKVLKDYPHSKLIDDANYFLGVTYFQKGDFTAARQQLEKFVNDFKDSAYRPQAIFLLGECLLNLSDFKAAMEVFKMVIREYADQESLRQKAEYEMANVYAALGNAAEAHRRLTDFITRYPDSPLSPHIIYWLGESFRTERNYPDSRRYFERLIRNYPNHEFISEAYLGIAETYRREGHLDLALRNLEQAREAAKGAAQARVLLHIGDIYFEKADLDKAIQTYQQAVVFNGHDLKSAYLKIAAAYRKKKHYPESVSYLEKALQVQGPQGNAQIQFTMAEVLDESGDPGPAVEAYMKVFYLYTQESPLGMKALLRVANIYENKGDWTELKNILEKIAALDVPEAKYAKEKLASLLAEGK